MLELFGKPKGKPQFFWDTCVGRFDSPYTLFKGKRTPVHLEADLLFGVGWGVVGTIKIDLRGLGCFGVGMVVYVAPM